MKPLSILYIGTNSGTSRHRALALQRLGHRVTIIDPFVFLPNNRLTGLWIWKAGGVFLEDYLRRRVLGAIPDIAFNLVVVDGGEFGGPVFSARTETAFWLCRQL